MSNSISLNDAKGPSIESWDMVKHSGWSYEQLCDISSKTEGHSRVGGISSGIFYSVGDYCWKVKK